MEKPVNIAAPYLKRFKYPLLMFLLLVAGLLNGLFWWRWATAAPSLEGQEKIFVVKKGEGLSQVAVRLKEGRLIRSSLVFKILALSQGMAGKIQAGDFRLSTSMDIYTVAQTLTHGTLDVWVTLPEGWRREESGRRLAANIENFNLEEFLRLTEDFEGKLFPDTYLIPKNASHSAVVKILTDNFAVKTEDLNLDQPLLILASIVEREARHEADRPIVAGVLIKRWRNGWALQADATLQYALASKTCPNQKDCRWWPQVSGEDKEINSPYNTYKYKGLPPTPIANPGLASILATLKPQPTDYWYYLSDADGKTHYAKTFEEHNQNIARYLK